MPEDKWKDIIISYDNMCQLDGMKVAKSPLPLPPPYNEMWLKVEKVNMLHSHSHFYTVHVNHSIGHRFTAHKES